MSDPESGSWLVLVLDSEVWRFLGLCVPAVAAVYGSKLIAERHHSSGLEQERVGRKRSHLERIAEIVVEIDDKVSDVRVEAKSVVRARKDSADVRQAVVELQNEKTGLAQSLYKMQEAWALSELMGLDEVTQALLAYYESASATHRLGGVERASMGSELTEEAIQENADATSENWNKVFSVLNVAWEHTN